jgi:hypothetical protein
MSVDLSQNSLDLLLFGQWNQIAILNEKDDDEIRATEMN